MLICMLNSIVLQCDYQLVLMDMISFRRLDPFSTYFVAGENEGIHDAFIEASN